MTTRQLAASRKPVSLPSMPGLVACWAAHCLLDVFCRFQIKKINNADQITNASNLALLIHMLKLELAIQRTYTTGNACPSFKLALYTERVPGLL